MASKFIFVMGGVVSGLGKGTMAASLGRLLKARGLRVTNQKFDPYINIDPGTMSPYRHGEVFVTEDGAECDLDVGHYERFIDENLSGECNVTTGKIYLSVIERERQGGYEGKDVQVIPHITDEIKSRINKNADMSQADVAIIEIGGTVGDIESLPFLEAIRQMAFENRGSCLFIHLTLVPYLPSSGEMKSKPTQHSVKELLSLGIQPDIIVCRAQHPLTPAIKDKIALFCNVNKDCVIQNVDVDNIYDVPLLLEREGLARLVCQKLSLPAPEPDLSGWEALCARRRAAAVPVTIALVGKYVELHDAYLSVAEALNHAAVFNGLAININWVDAELLEDPANLTILDSANGIIVPGGFGERGALGMMQAARYARERRIPYFGICLGMQCAVIDFARTVLGYPDAHTTEFGNTSTPIIHLMPGQRSAKTLGGTILRGAHPITFSPNTICCAAYNSQNADERHRHRYEINNDYRAELQSAGLTLAAFSKDDSRIEAVELPAHTHPWFVGVQFHPEFKSRPNRPHPLFFEFLKASGKYKK